MYEDNPYYSPEKFGLTLVAEVELSEPCYSFDTLAVWKSELSGGYYLGTDSGCSCPTPFENYAGLADLTGPLTAEQAVEESKSLRGDDNDYDPEGFEYFLKKITEEENN